MKTPYNSIIVFDIETGGLNPIEDAITEIALVALNEDLVIVDEFSTLISPYNANYKEKALEISGITIEMLERDGNHYEAVIEDIKVFLLKHTNGKKPIFAGHNIDEFDLPFLDNLFSLYDEDLAKYVNLSVTLDTMTLARFKWTELPNYKLGTCCDKLGITLIDSHRALADTKANTELLVQFLKSLRGDNNNNELETGIPKRFRQSFYL